MKKYINRCVILLLIMMLSQANAGFLSALSKLGTVGKTSGTAAKTGATAAAASEVAATSKANKLKTKDKPQQQEVPSHAITKMIKISMDVGGLATDSPPEEQQQKNKR